MASAPTISRINPSSGPTTGGISVVITGTNLSTPTAVTFAGTPVTTIVSSTATSINVIAPAGTAGSARVAVTTANGTSTQAVNFTYITVGAPTITSLSPSSGPQTGANTVTITGTNLLYANGVSFGATPASSFAILSSTQVKAVAPAGTGTASVTVTTGSGTSNGETYTYNTPVAAPTVSAVTPTNGAPAGGNSATISGSGFTNATAVTFGTTPATSFIVANGTTINAVVPAGSGAVNVTVTGAGGTSTGTVTYTYNTVPTPTVSALTPLSGPVAGGNTVTLTGTYLTGATSVTFGDTAATFTTLSSTEINATAPPGTAGPASVVVTTPGGASTGVNYTYASVPAPTAVFATTGITAGGDSVAITGSGLTGTTSVNFGTVPVTSFTVVNDGEVDAVTPPQNAGTVQISVTTPGGTDSSQSFSYQPTPVISSITPTSGPTAGGTVVTISGAGLVNTVGVYFGATAAASYTINSDNSVTATSPAGTAGVSAVTVQTDSATSNGITFTYVTTPTLTTLSPTGGPTIGGNSVTLTGTGFTSATNVFFGPNPAVYSVLDDDTITATAPSGTAGAVSVTVVNPGGTSGAQTYTYS